MAGTRTNTFFLKTFGCKSNQYDTQGIRESLVRAGMVEVDSAAAAALCVLNTCAVTGRANASCRNALRGLQRQNPRARVVITGCAIDAGEEWPRVVPGVEVVVPNPRKHLIAALVTGADCSREPELRFGFSLTEFCGRTRAYVKIQDGCDFHCSFCSIPAARGQPLSRPFSAILAEAQTLAGRGHGEIVFTGTNIGAYRGYGGEDLAKLVRAVGSFPEVERLRLGSVEPGFVTDELLAAIRETPTVCPHLHLPLQSGDDAVLKAMNRQYTTSDYLRLLDRVRENLDRPAITTDLIVGFPRENQSAFENTCRLCERARFSRTHVFLFSTRPGTPAATLPPVATDREITARKQRLSSVAESSAAAFAAACIGRDETVIVERTENGELHGYTSRYLRARFPGPAARKRSLVRIRVTGSQGAELRGDLL